MGLHAGWEPREQFESTLDHIQGLGLVLPVDMARYAAWVEVSVLWAVAFRVARNGSGDEEVLNRIFRGFEQALLIEIAVDVPSPTLESGKYEEDVAQLVNSMWTALLDSPEKAGRIFGQLLAGWYGTWERGARELALESNFGLVSALGVRSMGTAVASSKFLSQISKLCVTS
jgi:hypothetical protein